MTGRELLEKAVFIGGVPRSGTTFLARSLNSHPDFVVSADDRVLESWGLYYYRTRVGIVDGLRRGAMSGHEALAALERHHFRDRWLLRAVPSAKTEVFQSSAPPPRPDGEILEGDGELDRRDVPLQAFSAGWRLVLKSPEITYVLRDLAALLPEARFILVYRPLAEVAESMYRMGERVKKVRIFHRRWRDETDAAGRLIAPPGVPEEWAELWGQATDFQRCVINGASYQRRLAEGLLLLPSSRIFTYNHSLLRKEPAAMFHLLAEFCGADPKGFAEAASRIRAGSASFDQSLKESFESCAETLGTARFEKMLASAGRSLPGKPPAM